MTEQEFRKLVVYSMGVLAKQDVMHQVSFQLLDGHNDGLLRLQRGYKSNARIQVHIAVFHHSQKESSLVW